MLAEIGIMIGLYIITRMVSFILRKGERAENTPVKILSIITIIITLIFVIDLLLRGLSILPHKQVSSLKGYIKDEQQSREKLVYDHNRILNEGYLDAKWGMNKEEVKTISGASTVNGNLGIKTLIAGEDAYKLYFFTEDKLYMVVLAIDLETMNKDKYIYEYDKMEKFLIDKYGKPKKEKKIGSNNPHISDGDAIATGKGYYLTEWETPESKISLELSGDNFKMKFAIQYKSKKYSALAENGKKEKVKGKF